MGEDNELVAAIAKVQADQVQRYIEAQALASETTEASVLGEVERYQPAYEVVSSEPEPPPAASASTPATSGPRTKSQTALLGSPSANASAIGMLDADVPVKIVGPAADPKYVEIMHQGQKAYVRADSLSGYTPPKPVPAAPRPARSTSAAAQPAEPERPGVAGGTQKVVARPMMRPRTTAPVQQAAMRSRDFQAISAAENDATQRELAALRRLRSSSDRI
jgi:hypothetical protein